MTQSLQLGDLPRLGAAGGNNPQMDMPSRPAQHGYRGQENGAGDGGIRRQGNGVDVGALLAEVQQLRTDVGYLQSWSRVQEVATRMLVDVSADEWKEVQAAAIREVYPPPPDQDFVTKDDLNAKLAALMGAVQEIAKGMPSPAAAQMSQVAPTDEVTVDDAAATYAPDLVPVDQEDDRPFLNLNDEPGAGEEEFGPGQEPAQAPKPKRRSPRTGKTAK